MESSGPKRNYVVGRGTSDATAIVSGAAALVRSKFPELTAPQVIERLTSTATDIGPPGRDDQCGFGVLNIVKALTADVPGAGTSPSTPASVAAQPIPDREDPADPAESAGAVIGAAVGVTALGAVVALFLLRRRRRT
jgi:subtilisin family serine protease